MTQSDAGSELPRDVLVRPPWVDDPAPSRRPVVEMISELEELAVLLRQGLLSRAEFERQKQRLLGD